MDANYRNPIYQVLIYETPVYKTRVYTYKYIHTYIYTYTRTHTHTYIYTIKRALRARMSHSIVCNTTVSTKKTCRTLITQHACKGNTPVIMKEKYVFVQPINRGYGCVYVCVCVIIKQISSTQLLVCVCLCVCNESARDSAIKRALRCVCVCLYTSKIKGWHGCVYVCVCLSSPLSRRELLVCVCTYMYANTAERLRLHKTVFYC